MSTIESKPQVTDTYIDDVIRSNEVPDPDSGTTQGFYLRKLVKDLRLPEIENLLIVYGFTTVSTQ